MTKRLPQLADMYDCTGCMSCIDSCSKHAIKSYRGDDWHLYVRVDSDLCIGCLQCERICKDRINKQGNNNFELSHPYAAWALDDVLRSKSTSGGVFAAIAAKVIQDGGVVVGAAFDGRYARHIIIDSLEDLFKLQGSKYVQSNTEGIYLEIKKHLPFRKVLFSGVGCQVAAVLSFFSNYDYIKNLYTIDLICGGVPSDILIKKYFESKNNLEAITSFRSKRKYELKGIINGVEQILEPKALPLAGFYSEQTNRYSCYNCQFAYAHRQSDLTIGDLWGESSPPREQSRGVSLVLTHTERGISLLKSTEIFFTSIKWRDFLYQNARLVIGKTPLLGLRRHLSENISIMSESQFRENYTSSATINHPVLFLKKCIRAIIFRVYKRHNNYYIRKLF